MNNLIPIINDISVIVFDLLIFTKMISLKKDTRLCRMAMYLGCALIVMAYFTAAYVFLWPAAISSMIFMSIPSLILFFILSKHKDGRFIMTFCFVDSVSLIIAFAGRYAGMAASQTVGILSVIVTVALFSVILFIGKDYFKQYHDLLEVTGSGWTEMAVSMVMIYFALVFFSAYPKPMVERLEYGPVYLVFSAVVISFYVVFVKSILKTRQIYEQNKRLEYEKRVFQIAYSDALTGLSNRASYIECVNRLERNRIGRVSRKETACLMFDLNDLKQINDQRGHQAGDRALTGASSALKRSFEREGAYLFRLGGDEFCVLLTECTEQEVENRLDRLKNELKRESAAAGFSICLAAGCAFLKKEGDTIEEALDRADEKMYDEKRRMKSCGQN